MKKTEEEKQANVNTWIIYLILGGLMLYVFIRMLHEPI